jgi:hypothetical protein
LLKKTSLRRIGGRKEHNYNLAELLIEGAFRRGPEGVA